MSVSVDDAENVQKLPLVFVDSLDLDVKHGVDRDVDAGSLLDVVFANLFLRTSLASFHSFCNSGFFAFSINLRKTSVSVIQASVFPTHLVMTLLNSGLQKANHRLGVTPLVLFWNLSGDFCKLFKRERLDDIGVNLRDAIDGQTCNAAQVSHSHRFWWRFGFFHGVAHLRSASGIRIGVSKNRGKLFKNEFISFSVFSCL